MYIEPNTTIKLIRSCPLDKNYENTLYFSSIANQQNYFLVSLNGYTITKNSYQRVNKGTMRVAKKADDIYDCNYVAFQNTNYGNKWFYAFITRIDYVNDATSELSYEIDVIQTWMFDFTLRQCFVEREHSLTDEIGDNLVEEKIATGEYVVEGQVYHPANLEDKIIVIWSTLDANKQPNRSGSIIVNPLYINLSPSQVPANGWYFNGLTDVHFPATLQGYQSAQAWLNSLNALEVGTIVSINVAPAMSIDDTIPHTEVIAKTETLNRSDGNPVKNKKCLTYPYNFLYITNNQGTAVTYRYEFFSDAHICNFRALADISVSPTAVLIPENYKGVAFNFDERISLQGYTQIGYNIDSFKAWLAQTATHIPLEALSPDELSDFGTALALANTGSPAQLTAMGSEALVTAAGFLINGVIHSAIPPQAKGNNMPNLNWSLGELNFSVMHKHITPEYLTIIDDYFNMYGYATNKVKVPNISSRPEWNYVKTIGCKIDGGLPAEDAYKIETLFDRGIRFWKYSQHIGDYSYDNSPVTPT